MAAMMTIVITTSVMMPLISGMTDDGAFLVACVVIVLIATNIVSPHRCPCMKASVKGKAVQERGNFPVAASDSSASTASLTFSLRRSRSFLCSPTVREQRVHFLRFFGSLPSVARGRRVGVSYNGTSGQAEYVLNVVLKPFGNARNYFDVPLGPQSDFVGQLVNFELK
jgi:hypothetical protein